MAAQTKWLVIINPTSGSGRAKRKWPEIQAMLLQEGFEFDFQFTEFPNHSHKIVQESVLKGITHYISVGGDGTLHNIINGIMAQSTFPSKQIKVGVIPIGTGNDWVKTYNIPRNIKEAVLVIKSLHEVYQDVGKIVFPRQSQKEIYFNNLAGVGFDGCVVHKVGKFKHFGALAYLIGALFGMFKYKNSSVEVKLEDTIIKTKALMVLVGLCQFSGGGMQLTKNANPADGLFDISIARNLSKRDILFNLTNLFNGKITNHKKVSVFKSKAITITANNPGVFIQADGELVGQGGFSASIIPDAFCFYGIKKPA